MEELSSGDSKESSVLRQQPVQATSGGILSPEFKEGKEVLCSYTGVGEEKGNKKRDQKMIGGLTNPHKYFEFSLRKTENLWTFLK